jgi:plastocyanin
VTDVRKLVPLLPLILVAAGCGSTSSGSAGRATTLAPAGSNAAPVKTVTIDESEFKLQPASVNVAQPGAYILRGVNKGTIPHAIAIEGNGVDEDGPVVGPGKVSVLRVTIAKKGSYQIYCPVDGHKDQGMKGTLTVGGSGSKTGTSTGTSTGAGGGGY